MTEKLKYRAMKRVKEPTCTPVIEWVQAVKNRDAPGQLNVLGAVCHQRGKVCAIALMDRRVVALPLERGMVDAFAARLQTPHAEVYASWVQMFQNGTLANPAMLEF